MPIFELYHGCDAQKMLFNIQRRGLTADDLGQLYFAQQQWTNCLVHGTDSQTRESYVVQVRVDIPAAPIARIERSPRSGNPDALIVNTMPGTIIPCEFLQMFVRSGNRNDGFEVSTIPGPSIEQYLRSKIP